MEWIFGRPRNAATDAHRQRLILELRQDDAVGRERQRQMEAIRERLEEVQRTYDAERAFRECKGRGHS